MLVIGGGAAGLACVLASARLGLKTTLLERTGGCGKKLALTGGRKGNFTHQSGPREMAGRFDCDPAMLTPLLRDFPYQRIVGLFDSIGVKSRVDAEGCIWPLWQDAAGIRDSLVREIKRSGGTIRTGCRVTGILPCWKVTLLNGETIEDEKTCLATGGASYPQTGSTGDGLQMARALGLRTTPWFAALASLTTSEEIAGLAGITQPVVLMKLEIEGTVVREAAGHFIFAHGQVSGSSVLNLCGFAARALAQGQRVTLDVDWAPEQRLSELADAMVQARTQHPRQQAVTFLSTMMARRLAALVADKAAVPPDRLMTHLSRSEQARLVQAVKGTRFEITGTEPIERATVTGGGVSLEEVNLATLEAHRFPGLYFAGEVLDTWAETGGYNLHFAWATGIRAAESAAGRKLDRF